jgi:hypothetical protein
MELRTWFRGRILYDKFFLTECSAGCAVSQVRSLRDVIHSFRDLDGWNSNSLATYGMPTAKQAKHLEDGRSTASRRYRSASGKLIGLEEGEFDPLGRQKGLHGPPIASESAECSSQSGQRHLSLACHGPSVGAAAIRSGAPMHCEQLAASSRESCEHCANSRKRQLIAQAPIAELCGDTDNAFVSIHSGTLSVSFTS